MSLFSACSNDVLNSEALKQDQGQQQEKGLKHLDIIMSKEWDPSFDCDPIKTKKLIGQTNLTRERVLSITNAKFFRSANPGEAVTEDFRPDRITVVVDPKTKKIINSRCG